MANIVIPLRNNRLLPINSDEPGDVRSRQPLRRINGTAKTMSESRRRPVWLTIYLTCVVSAGALVIGTSVSHFIATPPDRMWFILAALTIATAFGTFRLPVLPITFSISEMFTILAALLFGPEAGALVVVLDGLTLSARPTRREFHVDRVLFNATAPTLSMWISAHVFFWLSGTGPLVQSPGLIQSLVGPLGIFAGLHFVLNTTLVGVVTAWRSHQSPLVTWTRHFGGLWLTFFGGASIAALIMVMMGSQLVDLNLLALVMPLVAVLFLMFKSVVRSMHDEFEQLKTVNRLYHSLIQGATYGIGRVSIDGRFIAINPALASILGYPVSELMERNLWTDVTIDPGHRDRILTSAQEALPISGLELPWRRKDGRIVFVRVSGRLAQVDMDSEPSFEMMVENVTERRALEEQIRQAQKMEAIGRLAGGVAHDFNNLLTVIKGYGELLVESLGPDDRRHTDANEILQASDRASTLTRQLLAFSRRAPVAPRVLALDHIVIGIEQMLRRLIGEDVQLQTSIPPGIRCVMSDSGEIDQVLLNLAVNARDAMPNGGMLRIELANFTVAPGVGPSTLKPGPHVRLSVIDNGSGMTEETVAHIFEPFFTTKGEGAGTGLGLAMVYGVVNHSFGAIEVDSEIGRGTAFHVYLPAAEEPNAVPLPEGPVPLRSAGGSETVLLVEDETHVATLISATLTKFGYTILQAIQGAQALEIARTHAGRIDLLLTDVVMPGMNGREVADRVMAMRRETCVLYMSGYPDDAILRHGVQTNAVHFIQKPFSMDNLMAKMRQVLADEARSLQS